MKRILLSAAAGLSLLSAPVAAQTAAAQPTADELEAMGALFGDLFGSADPLSPEEEAAVTLSRAKP